MSALPRAMVSIFTAPFLKRYGISLSRNGEAGEEERRPPARATPSPARIEIAERA